MNTLIQMFRIGNSLFQAYFMCGNYIVQAKKYIALSNQTYLWFASLDFFSISSPIINKTIRLKLLVRPTFEKISDFSMHNVYWDRMAVHFLAISPLT